MRDGVSKENVTHRSSGEVLVGSSQVREGKSDIFFNGYCGGWG